MTKRFSQKDIFFDWYTHALLQWQGANILFENLEWGDIPLHYRVGVIAPRRVNSAMTTTDLRIEDFEIVVDLGGDGTAQESFTLAMESVSSFVQKSTTFVKFSLDGKIFGVEGAYVYDPSVKVARIIFLRGTPHGCSVDGLNVGEWSHDTNTGEFVVPVGKSLTGDFSVSINKWEIEIVIGSCNKL